MFVVNSSIFTAFRKTSAKCNESLKAPQIMDLPKFDWIQEEETLLRLVETDSFNTKSLDKIAITLVYIDENQEIIHVKNDSIKIVHDEHEPLLTHADESSPVPASVIEWPVFKQYIDSNICYDNQTYVFSEASLFHNILSYNNMDSFIPCKKMIKLEKGQPIKLSPTISVLHDLSQIFVLCRKPDVSTKSILKKGDKINKTKKVRICDGETVFVYSTSSRKTKRTLRR